MLRAIAALDFPSCIKARHGSHFLPAPPIYDMITAEIRAKEPPGRMAILQRERRNRIRSFLIIAIVATIPCYCLGLAMLQVDSFLNRPTRTPTNTYTPTITGTTAPPTDTPVPATGTVTVTLTPTLTFTPSLTFTAFLTPTTTITLTPSPPPPTLTNTPPPPPTLTPTSTPTLAPPTLTPSPTPTLTPTESPDS